MGYFANGNRHLSLRPLAGNKKGAVDNAGTPAKTVFILKILAGQYNNPHFLGRGRKGDR